MIKKTDIYGFFEDVISLQREEYEKLKEQHDKERWKQSALGNHEEAMVQTAQLCGDLSVLSMCDYFERLLKSFQQYADSNGMVSYEVDKHNRMILPSSKNKKGEKYH